jgi:hypothetical protein
VSWIAQRSNYARKNMQPRRRKLAIVSAQFDLFQDTVDENFFVSLNLGVLCVRRNCDFKTPLLHRRGLHRKEVRTRSSLHSWLMNDHRQCTRGKWNLRRKNGDRIVPIDGSERLRLWKWPASQRHRCEAGWGWLQRTLKARPRLFPVGYLSSAVRNSFASAHLRWSELRAFRLHRRSH